MSSIKGMRFTLLFCCAAATAAAAAAAAAAADPYANQQLQSLAAALEHRAINETSADEARQRFLSLVGEAVNLTRHEKVLKTLSAVGGKFKGLMKKPAINQDVMDKMTDRPNYAMNFQPSIADNNKPIAQYLYGGDVLLSQEDLDKMDGGSNHDGARTKRGAPLLTARKWNTSRPIGFIFGADIDGITRQIILTGLQKIQANTCLSFKENSGIGTQLNFVRGGWCWSSFGDQGTATQLISIDKDCEAIGVVLHEVSHALGIDHTQSRKDRDAYVTVNMAAVDPGFNGNFFRQADSQNDNFGVPYEYGSIMHYFANDFSTNGAFTIIPSNADYVNTMGQRRYETFNDYKLINALYNCSASCHSPGLVCLNGGYPSPRQCNYCTCSDFYVGSTCATPRLLYNINASRPYTSTYHQEWNATAFQKDHNYNWDWFGKSDPTIIKAPVGSRINVTLNRVYGSYGNLPCRLGCPFYGIEIVDNKNSDFTSVGKIFCCGTDEKRWFVSLTNVVGYKAYASPGMPFDAQVTFTVV